MDSGRFGPFGPLFAVLSMMAVGGCSGSSIGGQGTTSGDTTNDSAPHACAIQSAVSASEIPPDHRAVAAACTPTPADANFAAFGPTGLPCTSDEQCRSDGGLPGHCLGGACTIDECLTDDDCGAGVCVCSAHSPNSALVNLNSCVRYNNCRIDADCGANGYCVPSASVCTGSGFFCHTAADTCVDPAIDCAPSCINACLYDSDRGAFACMAPFQGGC